MLEAVRNSKTCTLLEGEETTKSEAFSRKALRGSLQQHSKLLTEMLAGNHRVTDAKKLHLFMDHFLV